jgi:hypothetical protein
VKIALKKKQVLMFAPLVMVFVLLGVYLFHAKHEKTTMNNKFKGKKIGVYSMEQSFANVPAPLLAAMATNTGLKDLINEGCKEFVGTKLPVNNSKVGDVWVVTTPGCGWGAHTAPMWFLQEKKAGQYALILDAAGIGLDIYSVSWFGLRDIVISDGSAGYYTDAHYRFDGKKYNSIESRMVMADEPEACKKVPEVFTCR